jgi:hypothetical protein
MNFKILFYNICFPLNQINLLFLTTNNTKNGYYNIYIKNEKDFRLDIVKKIYLYQNQINYLIYFNNTNINFIVNKTLFIDKINYFTRNLVYQKLLNNC